MGGGRCTKASSASLSAAESVKSQGTASSPLHELPTGCRYFFFFFNFCLAVEHLLNCLSLKTVVQSLKFHPSTYPPTTFLARSCTVRWRNNSVQPKCVIAFLFLFQSSSLPRANGLRVTTCITSHQPAGTCTGHDHFRVHKGQRSSHFDCD